jgi:hypothetical protein
MTRVDIFDPSTWLNCCWFVVGVAICVLVALAWPQETDNGESE